MAVKNDKWWKKVSTRQGCESGHPTYSQTQPSKKLNRLDRRENAFVAFASWPGLSCNVFSIFFSQSHHVRIAQSRTCKQSSKKQVSRHDCIVIMGDMNKQLQSSMPNLTGKWCGGEPTTNSHKIISIMAMHDLCAINTYDRTSSQDANKRNIYYTDLYTRKKAHRRRSGSRNLCRRKGGVRLQRQIK